MPKSLDPAALLENTSWLRGLARRLVSTEADADEVVQRTVIRAIDRPPQVTAALPRWLAIVAKNEARQIARSEGARRARQERVARPEASVAPAERAAMQAELQRDLIRHVLQLPTQQRNTVLARFFDDLTPSQIARRDGVPASTVRVRLKRGLAQLRAELDQVAGGDRDRWRYALVSLQGLGSRSVAASDPSAVTAKEPVSLPRSVRWPLPLAACALLALAVWFVARPTDEVSPQRVADAPNNEPRAPALRGTTPDPAQARVPGKKAPPTPPAALRDSSPHIALRFEDSEGRTVPFADAMVRYREAGVEPSIVWVNANALNTSGLAGYAITKFGPPEAWNQQVRLNDLASEAMNNGVLLRAPSSGSWQLLVSRPWGAPYATPVIALPREQDPIERPSLSVSIASAAPGVRVRVVRSDTDEPLAGARVTPYYEWGDDQAFVAGSSRTLDVDGSILLPVLEEGLRATPRGSSWWIEGTNHIALVSDSTLMRHNTDEEVNGQPITLRARPLLTVRGKAWRASGAPAVDCLVLCGAKGRDVRAKVRSDGTYTLERVASSGSRLNVVLVEDAAKGLFTMAKVSGEGGDTITVNLGEPATATQSALVGRITCGGVPLANVAIMVGGRGAARKSGQTDATGAYRIDGIDQGEHPFAIYLGDVRMVDDFGIRGRIRVGLDGSGDTRFDADMPSGALVIRFVDAKTGESISGAGAAARPDERKAAADFFPGHTFAPGWGGRVGSNGILKCMALLPGAAHTIEARAPGYKRLLKSGVLAGTVERPLEVTLNMEPE